MGRRCRCLGMGEGVFAPRLEQMKTAEGQEKAVASYF